MLQVGSYVFKQAETEEEFEQIHHLNYRTFVKEIRQHGDTGSAKLVDKFHHKNLYFIVLKSGRLVGMLSAHDQPPFSVAERLHDPLLLQGPNMQPLEVRLLAIEPAERNSSLFFGLIWTLYDYALRTQKSHLIISGVTDRMRLYERLGFAAIGPAVPSGNATFVPMMLTVGQLPGKIQRIKNLWENHLEQVFTCANQTGRSGRSSGKSAGEARRRPPSPVQRALSEADVCLLPGPVTVSQEVRDAFTEPPMYHRGPEFIRRFNRIRSILGDLVGGRSVALLNGSGTLANETVAATLAALPYRGNGVLLVNGEFGSRLARQAARFGLKPKILSWEWGQPWNLEEVEEVLSSEPPGSWIWGVHQESSTGVLNDLSGLVKIAQRHGIRVCADCISSLGAVPLDLSSVFLATGSSGKSLGCYAGAALVFADPNIPALMDRSRIPSYVDLAAALTTKGPCYTFPSSIVLALEAALDTYATSQKARAVYQRYAELGAFVRSQLGRCGVQPLADEECACPVLTTFGLPENESSLDFVERCRSWGYAIGGQSGYLAERHLVQIATMGAINRATCEPLFEHLSRWFSNNAELVSH